LNFLAEACALIAFHGYGGQTMSAAGRKAMAEGDIAVSPITVWEISGKIALGKLERPARPASMAACRSGCGRPDIVCCR
jgi:PIN domain nuclease of toxin-antitoxin system